MGAGAPAGRSAGPGSGHPYRAAPVPTQLKVSGINLFSAGEHLDAPGLESLTLSDPRNGCYRKLLLRDNRLAGIVLYGDTADGQWYFELLQQQTALDELIPMLPFGRAYCIRDTEAPGTAEEPREMAV
ncbi:hypothetical protein [Marinobacterium aestuariivivens]|uniref:NADH-rubredoxin oxidoreductase C-terminal domain-containing protein n=1 Tax=Marinobacterium aestuariivivens TaxID=1698799 RepID=A0ABW2A5C2_9GAMM